MYGNGDLYRGNGCSYVASERGKPLRLLRYLTLPWKFISIPAYAKYARFKLTDDRRTFRVAFRIVGYFVYFEILQSWCKKEWQLAFQY